MGAKTRRQVHLRGSTTSKTMSNKYTLNVFFLGYSLEDFQPLPSSEAVKFVRIKERCLLTELEQRRSDNEVLILVSRSLNENETEAILAACKPFFQSCFLTTDDLLQGVTGSDNAEGKTSLRVEQNLKNMLEKMLERIAFQFARETVNALVYLSNIIKEEKLVTDLELYRNNMLLMSSECTDDIVQMSKQLRENAQPIRELLEESRCMFKRSRIPDDEKPVFPRKPQRTKNNVLQELLKFGGVLFCGDKFGTLMILMDEKLKLKDRTEQEKEIRTFLESKDVKHFQFNYISPEMNHLYKCGHKVFESPASGTLGCFVHNIGGPTRPYDIYALISRHVAMFQVADDFVIDGCDVGKVLSPMVGFHDIAVAGMHNSQLPWLDEKFKTETRDDKRCHVFDFKEDDDETLDYLSGLPVHIWGASSSPGVGRIAIEHCVSYGFGGQICSGIIIEDRRYLKKPFSKPGDSGSIICSFNIRNDSLFALGMVCGEYKKQVTGPKQRLVDHALPVSESQRKTKGTGQYYALRIDEGLKQLSENHGGRFVLKDDIPLLGKENQNSTFDNTSTNLPLINADVSEEISSNDNSIQKERNWCTIL
ncbi:hypothetical protein MAR_002184 [Mya arenaria]|uniref:Uncharacterized protein n=1 Tax=Mya arenaria TaxID=6604 RepID=A0ABY7FHV8_MYAAR|nr:hypothetical protein MAR_002184 [Mya arenaria]